MSSTSGRRSLLTRTVVGSLVFLVVVATGVWLGLQMATPGGSVVFGAIANAFIALAMMVNPLAGMLLWVVASPFSHFVRLDISMDNTPDITLPRIGAAVLIFVLLAQAASRKSRYRWHFIDVIFALAALGIGLSVLDAVGKGGAASFYLNSFLIPFIVYFVSRRLVTGWKEMRAVVYVVVGMAFFLSLIAMTEQWADIVLFDPGPGFVRHYGPNVRRIVSLMGSPAFFGVVFGMAVPFVLFLERTARSRTIRLAYLLVLIALLVGAYLTYVRAAWLGLAAALLVCALSNPDARKIVVALGLAVTLTVTIGFTMLQDSLLYQQRITDEGPIDSRLVLWATSMSMVADSPVRGIGFMNFREYRLKYLTSWGNLSGSIGRLEVTPHNTFLWVLVHSGLVGFTPWIIGILGLVTSTLWNTGRYRKYSRERRMLVGAFWASWVAFMVNAFFGDMHFNAFVTTIFFLISGSVLGLLDHSENA